MSAATGKRAEHRNFETAVGRWARMGPYYAMFPVDFAFRVVDRYARSNAPVLDPFAGRGTSVFAAAAILFIGLSLLLMAVLGHPGCEVLAFPALILGRRTHLACLFFTPIDWAEGKLKGLFRTASS